MMNVPSMVTAVPDLLTTLRGVQELSACQITAAWPRTKQGKAPLIVVQEIANNNTRNPAVDELGYQVDIWADDPDVVRSLYAAADSAITAIGFKRNFSAPQRADAFGVRQTVRYRSSIDKRFLRLVD